VKPGAILGVTDAITIEFAPESASAEAENVSVDIVFQDAHLMIINKPRGMVVHPGNANRNGTLLNGLLYLRESEKSSGAGDYSDRGKLDRAGIVHRLDKNTAGLMLVAKTAEVQAKLSAMFERHEVKRTYVGLVEGRLEGCGTIDKNIARDTKHRTLFKVVSAGGRRAVTHYSVIKNYKNHTLVEFNLETGRTHQIRVHCKSINHALVGDPEYNPNSTIRVAGQLLESVEISFTHPVTREVIEHKIPLTREFAEVLSKL
jgi:23S rRNA pseudouridine1911/1915/1917 synthase